VTEGGESAEANLQSNERRALEWVWSTGVDSERVEGGGRGARSERREGEREKRGRRE
jgi:hypothetical protein